MASLAKTFPWLESCLGRLTIFLELPPLCYIHACVDASGHIKPCIFQLMKKNSSSECPIERLHHEADKAWQACATPLLQLEIYICTYVTKHLFFLSAPENIIHNNQIYMRYRIVSSLSNSLSVHMFKKARTANSAQTSPVCTMAAVNQEATKSRQADDYVTNKPVDSVHSIALFTHNFFFLGITI